jgi:hypothetical protein
MREFVPNKTLVPIPTIAQPSTTGAKINGFFFVGGKFLPNFFLKTTISTCVKDFSWEKWLQIHQISRFSPQFARFLS